MKTRRVSIENEKLYDAHAACQKLDGRRMPMDFAHAISLLADAVGARLRIVEKDRVAGIKQFQQRDENDKPAFLPGTQIPMFVDGGHAAYDEECERLNAIVAELEVPELKMSDLRKLKDVEPIVLRGLRPFIVEDVPKLKIVADQNDDTPTDE